jgi:hypothetical protein
MVQFHLVGGDGLISLVRARTSDEIYLNIAQIVLSDFFFSFAINHFPSEFCCHDICAYEIPAPGIFSIMM